MSSRTYSLRPPAVAKDALEALFRVEMKKDDMTVDGIKPGDAIAVISQTSGRGGVGAAYLSSDTSKVQGNNSFVKLHPRLREFFGLELSDKCSISKYNGSQGRIKTVRLSIKSNGTDDGLASDDMNHWAATTLERQFGVAAGSTFSVSPIKGVRSYNKRTFTIDAVESESHLENEKLAVPSWYDCSFSTVYIDGAEAPKKTEERENTDIPIQLSFTNLPGLEDELCQLSTCVDRVNRQVEIGLRHLQACIPLLIHGSSGVLQAQILDQTAAAAGWKTVARMDSWLSTSSSAKGVATITTSFANALASQPSLLIIEDIDHIAGRQSESIALTKSIAKHIVKTRGNKVQIIATARRPIDVHEELLSCFTKFIELPTPTPKARLGVLKHYTSGHVEESVLQDVANNTHAFSFEDLRTLCIEAYERAEQHERQAFTGQLNGTPTPEPITSRDVLQQKVQSISQEDFQFALRQVHPSLMNELYIEVPKVLWSEIAGSAHVKRKLWEAVELPLKHPEIVSKLNLHLNHGILLYGPPGCSKTMTAKALATESGLNFIAVKGPELVSKYVGESEYKIREIFRKARAASPSVIFFDEIDSIAPSREGGGGHEGLNTVATLLNEMDGVEDVQRVLVLAATNRPDAIDPALLRPGRLGTSLYVGPPDRQAIFEILDMRTKKMGGAGLDLEVLATKMAENGCYSGADIGAVCDAAGMLCAMEAVEHGHAEFGLQQKHLEQALGDAEPSLNREQLELLSGWSIGRRH